jgi:hypothetical protein
MEDPIPPVRKVELADKDDTSLESTVASPDKIDINDLPDRVAARSADLSESMRKSISFFMFFAFIAAMVGVVVFLLLLMMR